MKLKGRLAELAEFYSGEETVWDVGCDHGLLGLSFLGIPNVKCIHLVDPSAEVIAKLKENKQLDSYITKGKVFINHMKGQEIKLSSDSNKIFIAGMGGKEIISILQNLLKNSQFTKSILISPHKNILELREYLRNSDYRLRKEILLKDNDRFYQAMDLNLITTGKKISPYGEEIWESSLAPEYRDYLVEIYRHHMGAKDQAYFRFLKSLSF